MKKVILGAFALLTVGVLSAQDNKKTPTDQLTGNYEPATGVTNEVFIVQREEQNGTPISSTDPNEIFVDQMGSSNYSHNVQKGRGNFIDVDQTGTNNASLIQQMGNGNTADAAEENKTFVFQNGTGSATQKNILTIDSDGSFNTVNAYQDGKGNNKNEALSISSGFYKLENQLAFNDVIDIKGNNNTADLIQMGNNNQANIKLFDYRGNGSSSTIKQGGNNNEAYSFQAGLTGNTKGADVDELTAPDAENNTSWINQGYENYTTSKTADDKIDDASDNFVGGADNNFAQTQQYGTENESYVTQLQDWNKSFVHQVGNDNLSNVDQIGTGSEGKENLADVYQEGSWNEADVDQSGLGNTADIDSYSDMAAISATNYSKVDQVGNNNYAKNYQDGSNSSEIFQTDGNSNWAEVEQHKSNTSHVTQKLGNHNDAYIFQNGIGNWSHLTQQGNRNLSNINQYGNNNFSQVTQNSSGGM